MINLPENILKNSISLSHLESPEIAFPRKHMPVLLEYLKQNSLAVLGGDVLDHKTGEYQHNYDNWYLNKTTNETWENYVINSIEKTRAYIDKYPDKDAIFVLVLSDENNFLHS